MDDPDGKHEKEKFLKELKKRLKDVFRGYRTMTAKVRSRLKALGFTIQNAGKHFKVYFLDDFHHAAVVAKTASDAKAGINNAEKIYRFLVIPYLRKNKKEQIG